MSSFEQIPFDLPHQVASERDDLIESPSNTTAVELIDSWPSWPGRVVILAGPVGSGKSHFANIWAEQSSAATMSMSQLTDDIANAPEVGNMVLDNAEAGQIDENTLFHLFNRIRSEEKHLLITSRYWPQEWNLKLPDLISRVRAAILVELQEPDDQLLKQVILKLFADRQVEIAPEVIDFLVVRMERSLEAAEELVKALDREALSTRSRITKPLAGRVLREMQDNI